MERKASVDDEIIVGTKNKTTYNKMRMTRTSNVFFSPIITTLLLMMMMLMMMATNGFEFQHDHDKEECQQNVDKCTTDNKMWYKCPITCSKHYEEEGLMAEERSDPEQFYQLRVTKSNSNSNDGQTVLPLEDNEGYLTLFAVLPVLPGMAQYYYDAIDHISSVYKYTLVPMILPVTVNNNEQNEIEIQPSQNSKCILLQSEKEDTIKSNTVLQYLLTRKPVAGNSQLEFTLDRPTIFLVSHTGMYVERIVAPTMEMMERRIKVHELSMTETEL